MEEVRFNLSCPMWLLNRFPVTAIDSLIGLEHYPADCFIYTHRHNIAFAQGSRIITAPEPSFADRIAGKDVLYLEFR